jgi:TRAP-type uncharacterized transport system substrate-binding protein
VEYHDLTSFAPRTITVDDAPSGRKYVLRQLSAFEQMQADSVATGTMDAMYYRLGLSIAQIDDKLVAPRPTKAFTDVFLKSIPGDDADKLILAYANAFTPLAQAATIKNESTPSD